MPLPLKKPISPRTPVGGNASIPRIPPKETVGRGYLGKSPLAMVVYGPSGVGKTDFAAHFPNVGFIIDPQEQGINRLLEYNQTKQPVYVEEVDTFRATLEAIDRAPSKGIQTLVLDSLTGFEKLCFQQHCEEQFDNDWSKQGFYSYWQGPKNAAKTDWPAMVDHLMGAGDAGLNVILIAHSQVKPFKNPDGEDYDEYKAYMENETWQVIHRWAAAVLFYNYVTEVVKKGAKFKAKNADDNRLIFTVKSPTFQAKNQYGLPPIIDAGSSGAEAYQNFEQAFKGAIGQ